jgi:hypothetical protein
MEHKRVSSAVTNIKRKCGIIYISTLPPHMNVTKVREIFSLYGDIGRVFLQPANTGKDSLDLMDNQSLVQAKYSTCKQ